jgi:DNA-binding NarL/FixJ family response regulator
MAIKVAIVEDHQLVLDGIRKLIEDECDVVATGLTGRAAVAIALDTSPQVPLPDIILMDIALPELNGIDAARQIKRTRPDIKIIFVTVQTHHDYVKEAFEVGASGYVLKQAASSELIHAIQEVSDGHFFLSPLIAERLIGHLPAPETNLLKLFKGLTPRQREVLQLVAEGKSAKEIASSLNISVKTVEFHKKHLMDELNLRNSAELIRYAVEKGYVAQ